MEKQSSLRMVNDLSDRLKSIEDEVLACVAEIWGKKQSLQQFHAQIGSRNNIFIDSVRQQFMRPNDYISAWLKGLLEHTKAKEKEQTEKYGRIYNTSYHNLLKCLKNEPTKEYVLKFLERRFYRQFEATTRPKPIDELWEVWFGANPLVWGILIAPVKRLSKWTNDISEIRRANYHYWTIGHIIQTGLVLPDTLNTQTIKDLNAVIEFYQNICSRISMSQYEKELMELYVKYLKNSTDPLNEPFLIPEMRFNKEQKHLYRLDLLVLNSFTMKFIGFEISPSSTHMKVTGVKQKTQTETNREISEKWERECDKRNQYYSKYGISVVTFTNQDLKNIDSCFKIVKKYLEERVEKLDIDCQLKQIDNFDIK
ncbi:hypothetical protein [Legionella pneumophila]|uniref:hypothetical protein n=1 Tax=Legionella pneumophila TaxID=446 RepID=UPI001A2E0190|nr:hypothetical protein [Legionella pneumophila]HAT9397966.1 topoisomerase II [Legionella pneumophila subsp. pneumophila]MCW8401132.1 hypothetical protein [Legionella pneumophila]MCZ4698208.1 hypothetical protein [Legionella pneumophila]MCZ4713613.1 hypothetical protein [Legionella pneumophila]MCZ4744093.1 hypothetical protein [Legionella pneumophila]